MSSITASANAERTNRWLLIGALVLALVAGVLVFAALSNFSSDDEKSTTDTGGGDTKVIVATQNIDANTKITDDMIEVKELSAGSLIAGAVQADDESLVVGQVTTSPVLQGEQLTARRLSSIEGETDDSLAVVLATGERGFAIDVSSAAIVAGFVVPGDHVDILGVFDEGQSGGELTRVETILQDVTVLVVGQEPVNSTPALDADGVVIPEDQRDPGRVDDAGPAPQARTVVFKLTPEQAQIVAAADADGELILTLRPLGEEGPVNLNETNIDDFGFLPPLPRP